MGAEKIREFADALGDPNPVYRDVAAARAAGHPTVIAPPTFAIIVINNMAIYTILADPALGLDWGRVVHGEQNFTHQRPIRAGDCLVLVATIEDIMARAGHDFLTIRTDLNSDTGETVCVGTTMLVVRGTDE